MKKYIETEHGTLRDPDTGHEYPTAYPPGTNPVLDIAWEILDRLKPGEISVTTRSFLAGLIMAELEKRKDD
jgi:hypothetical protein